MTVFQLEKALKQDTRFRDNDGRMLVMNPEINTDQPDYSKFRNSNYSFSVDYGNLIVEKWQVVQKVGDKVYIFITVAQPQNTSDNYLDLEVK